jgi:hypothetical protein
MKNALWFLNPIILLEIVVIISALGCAKSSDGDNFKGQSVEYYLKISNACDELILRCLQSNTNHMNLRGDDPSLPMVIKNLHPTTVKVVSLLATNRLPVSNVALIFGNARTGWALSWSQQDYMSRSNSTPWALMINTEDNHSILWATNR